MQQILAVLSSDADADTINGALGNGSVHSYLAPTVLLIDGDETVLSSLGQTTGIVATLSDDDATTLAGSNDVTQLDEDGMSSLVSTTLNANTTFDEPTLMAISGWIYGLSLQYQAAQSDRPRDGEDWDMQGGCLPSDDFANS